MIGEIAMKPKAPKDLPAKSPVNVKGGKLVANDNITLLRTAALRIRRNETPRTVTT